MKFIGNDTIIKKINHNHKFDIRFHLEPNIKLMKTQDNKTILIELEDEGWRFTCNTYEIDIDNGLYFGDKNLNIENQYIFITGISNNQEETIEWKIEKNMKKKIRSALISVSDKSNLKTLLKILKKIR